MRRQKMSDCNVTVSIETSDAEIVVVKGRSYGGGRKDEYKEYVLTKDRPSITLGLDSNLESISIGRRE